MKPRVLIAGAGLCGLTTALALLQRGYDVRVFEQATELREVGAGVQLGSNGTRVLIGLGLEAAMRRIVCEPTGKEIRLWTTGQTWPVFDLGVGSMQRYGAPYWMAHRGDFHSVLLSAVRATAPDAVHPGMACTGFDQTNDTVTLHLANGDHVTGDVLLAADGVHSAIRRQMFGGGRARFTGIMAWRGLVPMERLPPHMRQLVGTNWVGHGGHVVTYPLRRGEFLNFVGAVERDDWLVESWTEAGTRDECARDLARWHEDVQTIIRNIDVPYNGLCSVAILCRISRAAACACWATRRIPRCPSWRRARTWHSKTRSSSPGAWTRIPMPQALRCFEMTRLERTAAIVRGSTDNTPIAFTTRRLPIRPAPRPISIGSSRRIKYSSATTGCTSTTR